MLILPAPHNPIMLNISSMKLPSDNENSSHGVIVEFTWSRPSQRNGSYYFEFEYSAVQNFSGGRSLPPENKSSISGDQLRMKFNSGLPYAWYEVRILAYNIKRGRMYSGPMENTSYLSIPIGRLK